MTVLGAEHLADVGQGTAEIGQQLGVGGGRVDRALVERRQELDGKLRCPAQQLRVDDAAVGGRGGHGSKRSRVRRDARARR